MKTGSGFSSENDADEVAGMHYCKDDIEW